MKQSQKRKKASFRELLKKYIVKLVLKIFNTKKLSKIKTNILNLIIQIYFI